MTRQGRISAAACAALLLVLLVVPTPAQALTDRWAGWGPITGRPHDYATTMQQRSPGFPAATVASDSRAGVQLPSGASAFLGASTPPGAKYGSSVNNPYLVLRARADTATGASTTTYTFAAPTPDTGWAFVLGDIDADQVQVRATDANGDAVTAAEIDSWWQGRFNYAGEADLPTWDPATSTLTGNAAANDTNGASGWFEPDVPLTSLTFVYTRRAGFPVYQTWFVSRARPIGGTVADVSTTGSCAVTSTRVTLVSPSGDELATTTPAADGTYSFGELATQAGYVARIDVPDTCAVVGPAQIALDNRGNDGDPASRADFEVRQIIPQPISGTVRDTDGTPVTGATVTLTRPGGGTVSTTTADDGTYLFDDNALGAGYSLTLTVPDGYAAGPGGTTRTGITVASTPITGQDFVVRQLASVSGTVTGGGNGLGGVQVTVTPVGGGTPVSVVTQGDGTYVVPALPPGDYEISVAAPDGYTAPAARTVTVGTADVTGQDFALTRPGSAGGQVSDASGAGVGGVTITVDGPGAPLIATTDADGGWFIDGLPAGAYTATVTVPDGYDAVGTTERDFTITGAGEIRGDEDFALAAVTSPTPTPTASPTTPAPSPSAGPTTGGTTSTTVDSTAGSAGDLADTGGPARGLAVVGAGVLAAGLWLVGTWLVDRRRRPRAHR